MCLTLSLHDKAARRLTLWLITWCVFCISFVRPFTLVLSSFHHFSFVFLLLISSLIPLLVSLSFTFLCLFLCHSLPYFHRASSLKQRQIWLAYGRCCFEYRPRHLLPWLKLFVVYLRLDRHVTDWSLKLGHGGSVRVATGLRAGRTRICGSFPDKPTSFCLLCRIQTGCEEPLSLLAVGTRGCFLGVKADGAWNWTITSILFGV